MLLAGIVMAGLLQTGAAAAGAYADMADQGATAAQGQQTGDSGFGEILEAYLFWLIGLVAPALVGIKSAAMAGLSPRRISGRQGAKSKSNSQNSSTSQLREQSTRTSLIKQAKHGAAGVDNWATGGKGGAAAKKAGSTATRTKGAVGSAATTLLSEKKVNEAKKGGQAFKKGGKRAVKDAKSGTDYATRNLHQSPVDWAEAGLERYRENPAVDTSEKASSEQRDLSDFTDESESRGRSK
jgi:type IV secretion system protein TrbL